MGETGLGILDEVGGANLELLGCLVHGDFTSSVDGYLQRSRPTNLLAHGLHTGRFSSH